MTDARGATDNMRSLRVTETIEQIGKDTQRKKWLDVDEAISYGLVSKVLRSRRLGLIGCGHTVSV